MSTKNKKTTIIGSGPAGISAALYTLRAGIETTIISAGKSALDTAKEVENYYGFTMPISGPALLKDGIEQAKRLGATICNHEVVSIEEVDEDSDKAGFLVKTAEAKFSTAEFSATEFSSGVVILATGASRAKPKWPGLDSFEGMGVSYCAVCDAFFFRGKDVAVAGSGPYALHEAKALLPLVKSVTLCTDGKTLTVDFPKEIKIIETPVSSLEGESALNSIHFADGTALTVSGLFIALGTAGSSELANTVGADIKAGDIVVDKYMRTNVPGLLAAGDCTGGMKQIAKAVYEGAVAGTQAVEILRNHQLPKG